MPQKKIQEYKEVQLPTYPKIPRWLILQGEIDFRLFLMEKMSEEYGGRSGLVRMIDEATGFDEQLSEEAKELIAETRWLKREYDKETNEH